MIAAFLALLLAANPAPTTEAPAWTFTTGKNDDGEPYRAVSRSSPPFEIEYRLVEDYIPNLTIRIRETCNGGDWYKQHSIGTESDQLGNTLEAANDTLAEAVKACGLDPHVADHAMDGFIDAYALVIPEDPPSDEAP